MERISERLAREGITWPQFFFQFIIVLLGVYLAILSERKAEERNLQEDTEVMLLNILGELEDDEEELQRILDLQEVRLQTVEALGDVLAEASQANAPAVDSLLEHYLENNRTAFLRKSSYSALVAGGYLRSLVRTDLPVMFADLYERTYTRVEGNGGWQDYQTFEYLIPAAQMHFDKGRKEFINPGPEANVRFRNAALQVARGIRWYSGFLTRTLEEIRSVRLAVSDHLDST